MSENDVLAQIFAQQASGGGGLGDLGAFSQSIAANNPYRMAAAPIMGAKFNTSTWTPGQTFATALAQSFLGSALNMYAQNSEADQLASVAAIAPQLASNPLGVEAPEGVNPRAFQDLKLSTMARQTALASDLFTKQKIAEVTAGAEIEGRADAFKKLGIDNPDDPFIKQKYEDLKAASEARNAAEKAKQSKIGEIQGAKIGYGNLGTADPEDPVEKKAAELNTKFNALQEVKDFKYIQRLSTQLSETLKNPTSVDDPALSKMAVQIIEPGLSSTSGETAALGASSSIPSGWKGFIEKSMAGQTSLPPEVRVGLLRLAKNAYGAYGKVYQQSFDSYKKEGQRFKIEPSRISPIGDAPSFDSYLTGKSDKTPKEKALELLQKRGLLG